MFMPAVSFVEAKIKIMLILLIGIKVSVMRILKDKG